MSQTEQARAHTNTGRLEVSYYDCPFCGKFVSKDDILFVDSSFEQSYEDNLRFDFLMSCSRLTPLMT